jgi:pimeloyl-ACP methyl ester carboxylesterase
VNGVFVIATQDLDARSASKPDALPDGFESTFTPVRGHEVHALASKKTFDQSSEQIVLMHGATASRRYLVPTALLLAQHMQVFVPEMPGHGASSKPAHALKVEEQADVIYEWTQLNGLKAPYIFANSYGCQIAAAMTAKYPDVAKKLILSGPTCDPSEPTVWQQFLRLNEDGKHERKDSPMQLFADLADMGWTITAETVHEMVDNDIQKALPQIKCPTLVIRGEFDTVAPEEWVKKVASQIPGAIFKTIPGGAHSVNFSNSAILTSLILEFLAS